MKTKSTLPGWKRFEECAWYLRSPFDQIFNHEHWWDQQAPDEFGATYELARRHPLVGKNMLRRLNEIQGNKRKTDSPGRKSIAEIVSGDDWFQADGDFCNRSGSTLLDFIFRA